LGHHCSPFDLSHTADHSHLGSYSPGLLQPHR
jgi:hypothetical protein